MNFPGYLISCKTGIRATHGVGGKYIDMGDLKPPAKLHIAKCKTNEIIQ